MEILIGIGIFIAIVLLIEGLYFVTRALHNPELKRVRKQLKVLSFEEYAPTADIEKKRILSDIPWLNKILWRIPKISSLESTWRQSGTQYPLGVYILSSLVLFFIGIGLLPLIFTAKRLILFPIAVLLGMIPLFILHIKKKKRIQKFESQLPDALDLIARALKSGHAFSSGLKMVSEEFGDPLGPEFERTLDEVNFGIDLKQALRNLLLRLDCPDLKFFVIAIILQRETGGNLAEILGNISRLIRERFKLQGHIRTLSAEGRMSAMVLIGIPIAVALALTLIRPEYISHLFTDPIGNVLVAFALGMMIAGVLVIRKMIRIEV